MTGNNLEGIFRTGLLFIVLILMLIATLYFFFSVQSVISTWFEYEYSSIFSAIFSFVVIVVCIYLTRFYISRR